MIKLPQYIVNALKKGLKLRAAGHGGKGLVEDTVRAARRGVKDGEWSELKVLRASAWFARHEADRQRMNNPSKWDDPPSYSPAYTAWLLWGSDSDHRGRRWIDKKSTEIREEKDEYNRGAKTKALPKGHPRAPKRN